MQEPQDNLAYRFPISVKGVVLRDAQVVLLHNEREEWELPGGKLEPDESPEQCVVREIHEELGLEVVATALLDTWVYVITPQVRVLIVTYGCSEVTPRDVVLSHEHQQLAWVPLPELAALRMPEGYKRSVQCWAQRLQPSEPGNVVGREAVQEEGGETPSVARHSSRLLGAIEAEPPNPRPEVDGQV